MLRELGNLKIRKRKKDYFIDYTPNVWCNNQILIVNSQVKLRAIYI